MGQPGLPEASVPDSIGRYAASNILPDKMHSCITKNIECYVQYDCVPICMLLILFNSAPLSIMFEPENCETEIN